MQNKDIIEVLSPLLNSGRFTLHVDLAEALQLSRPLICEPWQLSMKVTVVESKVRTPKLQIVTFLHKHKCSEWVISLSYEVILQFLSWLMIAFTSLRKRMPIYKMILAPRDTQQISIFDVVYSKQHHKLWQVGENKLDWLSLFFFLEIVGL